jgi:hypothetical protein
MDYSFLIGVHQVDTSVDAGGVKTKFQFLSYLLFHF